ncbi:MAG: hypothetical protein Q8R02_15580 [Hyphomonadaceae bacterium]|nr:hypothetical protein [Hyphomonadaceae bacterium]
MTQALSRANWSGSPSLTGLWLEALLRGIAMLWSNVAATFRMIPSRPARECHTMQTPQVLPGETRDTLEKEPADPNSQSSKASRNSADAFLPQMEGEERSALRTIGPVDQIE